MHKTDTRTRIVIAALILVAMVAPFVAGTRNNYYLNILISYCYYGIMTVSLNLLVGYTGQISLGHGAFMAIGGYAYAILSKTFSFPMPLALVAALCISFLCGLLLGLACCKLNAIFLAIVTIGFARSVGLFLTNEGWLTGGANGFTGIRRLHIFGHRLSNFEFYYVALLALLLVFLVCYRLIYSKTGRAFQAVRTAPIAAAAMGINVNGYKFLVCGISAAMAGLAGILYALNINYLSPDIFNKTSVLLITMTVIGGLGSLFGPVLGTLVIGTMPELLRPFAEHLNGIYGVLIILVLRFMPDGIYGALNQLGALASRYYRSLKKGSAGKAPAGGGKL
jgi:branched-chain amino acid transport system permease protein